MAPARRIASTASLDCWAGQRTRRQIEPGATIVGLRFRPGVAGIALGLPASELRDSRVALDALWGQSGSGPGELKYPYDLAFSKAGLLYVVEYGNHRVQKFTPEGKSLGTWGGPGREPGRFHCPWALAVDSRGRVHVVDTENHRVQRIRF